jgi:hypothetical protein
VDECDENLHTCHEHATCSNTIGAYSCTCNAGFSGDGFSCVDEAAPVISCLATQHASTAGQDAVVVYANPEMSDNDGIALASCAPASGSRFLLGETTVTCYAEDHTGNSETCSFSVLMADAGAPSLTCPSNIQLVAPLGSATAVASWNAPNATDNSGEVLVPTTSVASGSAFSIGTTDVIASATDSAGNTGSCVFVVHVADQEAPTVACPASIEQATDPGVATAMVTWATPTTTDNSGGPITLTYNKDHFSGYTFPLGRTYVRVEARDASGNAAECDFNVRVVDTEPPAIEGCPADVVVANNPGRPHATVTWSDPVATDNSGDAVTYSYSPARTDRFLIGTTTVTASVADRIGNTATCTFEVTVNDVEAPVVQCPSNIIQNADVDAATASVAYNELALVSDNSGDSVIPAEYSVASGSTFALGLTSVHVHATDAAGNVGRCIFNVTVADAQPPAVTCPLDAMLRTSAGAATAVAEWADASASDNSGAVPTVTFDVPRGSTLAIGPHTVTATAADAAGNTASCTFTVTVNDVEAPTIACPGDIEQPADAGAVVATVSWPAPSTSDNSGGTVVTSASIASGSAFELGVTAVTMTATDTAGNMATCTFSVEIVDEEKPAMTCPAAVSAPTNPGATEGTAVLGEVIASDASGGTVAVTCSAASGDTFPLGTTVVICNGTDEAGNVGGCSTRVHIYDGEAPMVACPADVSAAAGADESSAPIVYQTPTATDNVGVDGSVTCSVTSGSSFGIGEHEIHCVAHDAAGNEGSCTFTAVVVDTQAPQVTCPADVTLSTDTGVATATFVFSAPTATDNHQGASIEVECDPYAMDDAVPLGTHGITCTATDPSGNAAQCAFEVTVVDSERPQLSNCGNVRSVPTDVGRADGTVMYTIPEATDNSGTSPLVTCSPAPGSILALGNHSVSCAASDTAGNTGTCSWVMRVVDNEAPAVVCAGNITAPADAGKAHASGVVVPAASAQDNSGHIVDGPTCEEQAEAGVFPIGETTVACSARDAAGNVGRCTLKVTVTDVEAPAISCPSNVKAVTASGAATASLVLPMAAATDNSGSVASIGCDLSGRVTLAAGLHTVACTAADAAGNENGCAFTVDVQDHEAPVVTCPSVTLVVGNAPGEAHATPSFALPPATDNVDAADDIAVSCAPSSGSTFALGTTSVTCSAVDTFGNVGTCSFNVRVEDREAPVLSCSAPLTFFATTETSTAMLDYALPAVTDNDPRQMPAPICSPEAGTSLAVGSHRVGCAASDSRGNTGTCSIAVEVLAPTTTTDTTTTTAATTTTTAATTSTTTTTTAASGVSTTTAAGSTSVGGGGSSTATTTGGSGGSSTTTGASGTTTTTTTSVGGGGSSTPTTTPTTTVTTTSSTSASTTRTTTTTAARVLLSEKLRYTSPNCTASQEHVDLVLAENLHTAIVAALTAYALDGVTVLVYPAPVAGAIQIEYSLMVVVSQQSATESAMAALAVTLDAKMDAIDEASMSVTCKFFEEHDYTRETDSDTIDSDGGSKKVNDNGIGGPSSYIVIAIVAGVVLLAVIILGVTRYRRRTDEGGFSLRRGAGAFAGADFSNPLANAAERGVAFDNEIYDYLDVDSSDDDNDSRDVAILVPPPLSRGNSRRSLEWQNM